MTDQQNNKPSVLFVTATLPCPPMQGSHLRVLNVARQLARFASLTMVYTGPPPAQERVDATTAEFGEVTIMPTVDCELPDALQQIRHKFRFHCPWHHSPEMSTWDQNAFDELYGRHDLVWFHTLRAADALRQYQYDNSIIDLDDLNQVKFKLMGQTSKDMRGKIANFLLAYKWRRWEQKALQRFDHAIVCSQDDKEFLGGGDNISVVPNGFEKTVSEPARNNTDYKRIGFIGLLGYAPNAHGMKWFAENVWPLIRAKQPDATVRIVGRVVPNADFSAYPGFEHVGFLSETALEISTWSAMIVPLHFGGGTRLKIVEAFSKKCPVISTSIGAHGLDAIDGKHILICDDPDSFASACIKLLDQPEYATQLAQNADKLFQEKYDWDVIGKNIEAVLQLASIA